MRRGPPIDHSGSSAYRWKSAWQRDEDDPEFCHVDYYTLPGERTRTIYEGDRFWDSDNRFLIEVVGVRTKVYTGVVAPAGDEGDDCVFYECLYDEPQHPEMPHGHWTDGTQFMNVEKFAEAIAEGRFTPHKANGIWMP